MPSLGSPSPSSPPLSSPSAPTPPPRRSSSWPAKQPQPRQQQHLDQGPCHRRATDAVARGASDRITSRAGARHQGAVEHRHGGPGGSDGGGGWVGGGLNGSPGVGSRGSGGDGGGFPSHTGTGQDAGDAVDVEVLNRALDAVRNRVKHYRMYLKPSFQVMESFVSPILCLWMTTVAVPT